MELVIIRTFDNYINANMMLNKLQNNGIECFLKDEFSATINPILSNAIGGIKLMVKDKDVKEATEMLKAIDTEYLLAAKCPNCGKVGLDYITKPGAKNFVTAILTWFVSSYAIAPEHVYYCSNCNWESKTLPEIDPNFVSDNLLDTV